MNSVMSPSQSLPSGEINNSRAEQGTRKSSRFSRSFSRGTLNFSALRSKSSSSSSDQTLSPSSSSTLSPSSAVKQISAEGSPHLLKYDYSIASPSPDGVPLPPTIEEVASLVHEQAKLLRHNDYPFTAIDQGTSSKTLRYARKEYLADIHLTKGDELDKFFVKLFKKIKKDGEARSYFEKKGILNEIEGFYCLHTVHQNMENRNGALGKKDLEMIRKVLIDNPINLEGTTAKENLQRYVEWKTGSTFSRELSL